MPDVTSRSSATDPASGPRIGALDGLRGLAVLAVCAFHFGVPGVAGGFLGVDVFYVLSGYLITSLLVKEFERAGTVRLGQFWARRARRLLPALLLVLMAVTLYVRYVALPGTYPGYRGDALATLFYFSNWHQIATSTDYFAATGPVSPLTHTWSLAIEEQFYLVWPLVVLGVLHVARSLRLLLGVCVIGAVASALEM
ncbi:MAG: acyltransferase family protein, partial [Acidimicrobiales bacterium]